MLNSSSAFASISSASCSLVGHWVLPPPWPRDSSAVTPATLSSPATLFPPSVRRMKFVASVLVPQKRVRSSSERAASQGPSAPCRATPPTGPAPTLFDTTAASRTCATWLPRRASSPASSSSPCLSSWPASPGEATSLQFKTPPLSLRPWQHLHRDLWRSAQEPDCVQRSQIRGPNTFTGPSPNLIPPGIAPAPSCPEERSQSPAP